MRCTTGFTTRTLQDAHILARPPYQRGTGPAPLQVATKIPKSLRDPLHNLRDEADIHARAWVRLEYVLRPLGFLDAHGPTGTPPMLAVELAV